MVSALGNAGSGELTLAVRGAERDDRLGIAGVGAGLVGAVTDAVAEVGHGAVARDVAGGAAKLGGRDLDHVADASFLLPSLAISLAGGEHAVT